MRKQVKQQDSLAKELQGLVEAGRLFDFKKRVANDVSLTSEELSRHPELLHRAVKSGFHSLVEVILKMTDWSQHDLQSALSCALYERRGDLAELLLDAGIPAQDIDFEELCSTMHVELMKRYLRTGGNPGKDNAFAKALSRFKGRPLLRFYKEMRAQYPILDAQAALALYQAVSDESIRWTCLLIWAGADPYRKVPHNLEDDWADESAMSTAASRACWFADEPLLRAMKLKPTRDQALELCHEVAFKPSVAKFEILLRHLSTDDLNQGVGRTCKGLESLIRHHLIEFNTPFHYSDKNPQRILSIEFLLKRGARWNPEDDDLKETRRALGSYDGFYVASVIRLLLYTPGAADIERIWELCRTPMMRSKILAGDDRLWDEIQEMRGHQRRR